MAHLEEILSKYEDNHHPGVKPPLVAPPGWKRLAPLISARHHLGLSASDLVPAIGVAPAFISRAERGRLNRVTRDFVDRYRRGLERVIEALEALALEGGGAA